MVHYPNEDMVLSAMAACAYATRIDMLRAHLFGFVDIKKRKEL